MFSVVEYWSMPDRNFGRQSLVFIGQSGDMVLRDS